MSLVLPTRKDEAWRYSDIDALTRVWPVAQEAIIVARDSAHSLDIINTAPADDVFVRHISLTLESGSLDGSGAECWRTAGADRARCDAA
jgi:Fe-S cluster assembly protein SufD